MGSTSLSHPACTALHAEWNTHGPTIADSPTEDLSTYLRKSFFKYHRALYENRPNYFPLSSSKKTFVAWVSIHRWTEVTLHTLLADHLLPDERRRTGELDDLRKSRADSKSKSALEKRITELTKLFDELTDFIDKVTEVADNGPPPADPSTTKREHSTRFEMDLNDGVMVNSAALWPAARTAMERPEKMVART